MEYSGGSEAKTKIGETARPPHTHTHTTLRPRDDWLWTQSRGSSCVQQCLVSCLLQVDGQAFTALLHTMESVLYNNNLLPKAEENKAGEKLAALF